MAKVIITIEDSGTGNVSVNVVFDPAVDNSSVNNLKNLTPAQYHALQMLSVSQNIINMENEARRGNDDQQPDRPVEADPESTHSRIVKGRAERRQRLHAKRG